MSIMCRVDDKFIPLYRVMWVAATPHFCGEPDCLREGQYEVRLEQGESVWAKTDERDAMISSLEDWQGGLGPVDPGDEDEDEGEFGDQGQW